jgi:hypothetical protein
MAGEARIGRLHKLYIDADGDIATPTWVEYGKIQGASRSGSRDVAEVKERDLDDTLVMLGHKNREITVTVTKRPGNTQFDLLQAAFEAGSKVGVAMMTGAIATVGEQGYQAEMYVTNFESPEENDSTVCNVTLRPCADYVTPPDFVEITE